MAIKTHTKKNERISSDDLELAYALDDVCRKQAEFGMDRVSMLRKSLKAIERGANDLGCSMYLQITDNGARYAKQTVEEFLLKAKNFFLDDDTFLEVTFIDGEPGNQFMLTFNDFDGNCEECAEFIFIPNDED